MSRKQRRNKTTLNAFRRVAPFARDWRSAASVTVLMLGGALVLSGGTGNAYAATPLPAGTLPNRPCSTSACQPFTPPAVTLGAGGVAFSNPGLDRSIRTLTVTQTAPKAVINWTSFDIASGSTVEFKQSNAGYIALNRIAGSYDYNTLTALTGPTTIQGNLTASGQLYLINQNGILFDRGSQINVNSLIAASLDVSDDLFAKGLLTAGINPVFSGGSGGFVKVEDGASITTPSGGRVMLLAPTVQNGGIIRTPDGQTILGAGQKVYLAASEDPSMRGLLIEVDAGGSATNLGQIVAERGNITLAGLAVNQSGRASATTSVNLNGSIRLLARDNATIVTNESNDTRTVPQLGKGVQARIGNHTGTVTLGAGSTTEVTLDADKTTTTTDAQGFQPSVVEVSGGRIDMQAGASIVAPSGNVSFKAVADPTTPSQSANSSRILIAAAAVIDVAGATAAQVAAERDSIRVELRGPELKDSPTQRNGFLRGKVVQIDASRGTTLADVSGYTAQIGRNVDERAAAGGSITLASEGDVITKAGSKLDVAGGQITHLAGFVKSTMLMSGGRVYDISDPKTPKDLVVDGFADSFTVTRPNGNGGVVTETMSNLVNSRGTYVTGYSEGKSAGTVKITGHALALDGALEGTVTPGPRQRSSSKLPVGGTLVIGDAGQFGAGAASFANLLTPDVNFVNARTDLPAGFGIDDALPNAGRVELTPEIFSGGFAKVGVYSNGAINVDTPLSGPAGGSLTLGGRAVNVNADIRMPAGSITLAARLTERDTPLPPDNLPVVFNHDVTLAAGVNLDTAGKWVNNSPAVNNQAGTEPLLIKGGSVALRAYDDVKLGANTRIDVAGGGALDSAGAFSAGDAGSIALAAAQNGRTVDNDNVPQTGAVSFGAGSVLSGFAAGKGGELNITTASMTIGAAARGLPEELLLAPALFTDNGFRKFSLTGLDGLVVADNTTLAPQVQTLTRRSGDTAQQSGARLTDFAGRAELSPALLQATELTLSSGSVYLDKTATTAGGPLDYKTGLTLGEGASITVKPGISVNSDGSVSRSSVTLNSNTSITLLGRVSAQSGSIALTTPAPGLADPATDGQAVYLGAASRLDVSGVFVPKQNSSGLAQGDVRNGGDINISVGRGFLLAAPRESDARPGATLDVSGGEGKIQMIGRAAGSGMPEIVTQTVHGNAGSITLGAGSMLFDGNLKGSAGGTAAKGQLTINTGELALTQSGTSVPAGYSAGTPLAAADLGQARIALDTIATGGFDTVNLAAATKISLNGSGGTDALTAAPLPLSLGARTTLAGRALTIDTPLLALDGNNSAAFAAPYIRLGNGAAGVASPAPNAGAGNGTLTFDADWIDVHGNLTLDNSSGVTMTSRGDIRFGVADTAVTGEATGGTLTIGADLTLKANQLYPATAASYTVNLRDAAAEPAHTLTILPGAAAGPVLSAGGALTLKAAHIEQKGVVKAPFGQITFDTRRTDQTDSINLYAGSTTSVAGEGTAVPYGLVQNGSLWTYQNGTAAAQTVTATPAKQIALSSTSINLKTAAGKADPTLNLSGGGDIYAYEWTPGPGGSRDYLSTDASSGGLPAGAFALVPALQGKMGPFDPQYWNGAGLRMGDSVVLAGGGPLPAGEYLRLPARYALQPGAYLVTPVNGFQDIAPGSVVTRTDGTMVVAGKFGDTLAGSRDERWSGFVLTPAATVRQQSEYTDRYASSFFSAAAPADAGRLSFNAVQTLNLDGAAGINLAGAFKLAADGSVVPGGRGGQLEISTPNDIAVVAGAPASSATRLELNATTLSDLGAASILLGGTRSVQADGTHIDVGAASVTVANDADHVLRAPEILLAAKNKVEITDGAKIDARGDAGNGNALILPNSGALFAATAADLAAPLRASPGATGNLVIGEATIKAGGTLLFDATGKTTIDNLATLTAPGVILSAGRIRLGAAPDSTTGLNLGTPILQQVSGTDKLTLRSYSSIDFYGAFTLGGASDSARPTISNLTLDTAGIGGYDTTALQTTSVRAGSVTLTNSNGVAASPFASAPNGQGTLRIIGSATTDAGAGRVVVGADKALTGNQKTLAGFSTVTLRAEGDVSASAADQSGKGEIVFEGTGKLQTTGNLNLEAPRISGSNGAVQALTAGGGNINITGSGGSAGATAFGAQLTLNANSITQSGLLDFASGIVNLNAGGGDVVVGSGGQINVRAAAVDFAGTVAHAPAGKVNLTATAGNVQIDGVIDISSAGGADAGLLNISAPAGSLTLNGSVNGAAAGGYRRGSLTSDTATLANFGALNGKLNAGNVGELRSFRARGGDVTLDGTTVAKNIYVSADAGKLTVTGALDASAQPQDAAGTAGGSIQLYATGELTLKAGSELRARGGAGAADGLMTGGVFRNAAGDAGSSGTLTTAAGAGGRVTVGTGSSGAIVVEGAAGAQPASQIDVSGGRTSDNTGAQITDGAVTGASGTGGAVTYRAPRISAPQVFTAGTTTGTTPATLYTLSSTLGSLNAGDVVTFTANHNSAVANGTSTFLSIKVNATTQKPVFFNDTGAVAANTILNNDVVQAVYDGVNFNIAALYRVPTFATNTYTVASYPNVGTSFKVGDVVAFKASAANTGINPSVRVGSTTAQIVNQDGSAITTGGIANNQLVYLQYDGSRFRTMPTVLANVGSNVKLSSTSGNFSGTLANNVVGAAAQTVEATQTYAAYSTPAGGVLNGANARYLAALDVKNRLGKAADTSFHVVAGSEFVSTGDMVVNVTGSTDTNFFQATRPAGEAGVLTLRSAGNLTINRGLSDGFSTAAAATGVLQGGNSWSYRLVGGANLARPDPLALADSGGGNVALGNGAIVRTGSGSIDIAAKGNITFSNVNSVVYTAGVPTADPAGFAPNPVATIAGDLPTGGGNLSLNAGGDIIGVDSKQLPSDWLYRQGQVDADGNYVLQLTDGGNSDKVGSPGWWVKFSAFSQNVGALGGGNVRVNAGGKIDTLSVSIPTTGRVVGSNLADSTVQVQGGGDLRITAGGDILNGVYYVGRGKGELDAGGVIGKSAASLVNPMLALGDGTFTLTARGDIALDGVFNPTLLPQARGNLGITSGAGATTAAKTYFSTYAPATGVSVTSLNGDVTFLPQTSAGAVRNAGNITSWQGGCNATTNCALVFGNGEENLLNLLPGSLQAVSMNGNVGVRSSARIALAPSAEGQLALLAGNNVLISSLLMSDADPAVMGTPRNPLHTGATTTIPEDVGARTSVPHASTPVHQDDTAGPARIVAARGNIQPSSGNTLTLNLAKAVELVAGNDITGLNLSVQNINSEDVSRVSAGNDVSGRELRTATGTLGTNNNNITVGGPGTLVVQAGRDVDLGNSTGILSRGNLLNTALPEQGAGIVIIAGVKQAPDYDAFAAKYLDPAQALTRSCAADCAAPLLQAQTRSLSATEQGAVNNLKSLAPTAQYTTRSYAAELKAFLGAAGSGLNDAAAYAAFGALKPDQRAAFVRQVFATELREAGRGVGSGGDESYLRGYAAIGTLFPRSDYRGDIKMFYSQVKTERGGGVDLLVPGGLVNAGLAVPSTLQDNSKQLGIVTVLNGAVNAMVHDDFLVNQSRVFTLGGGGITIWSSMGGIDAGKGSKTAALASPPVIKVDSQGNVTTELQGAASGSGIGVLLTNPGAKPDLVDLIAPVGTVDAGDAGIRASGGVFIAANTLLNAGNISAPSVSVGGGAAVTVSAPAAGGGASSSAAASSAALQAAQQTATTGQGNTAQNLPSIIIIDVIGLGEN